MLKLSVERLPQESGGQLIEGNQPMGQGFFEGVCLDELLLNLAHHGPLLDERRQIDFDRGDLLGAYAGKLTWGGVDGSALQVDWASHEPSDEFCLGLFGVHFVNVLVD